MRIEPVKGTSDYLPKEAALREYIQNAILSTYAANGFQRIMTPAVEDVENLDKSDGGDNLNLVFKILKRGQKLTSAFAAGAIDSLADLGLRYDLTLPLTRYYANNRQNLMSPFKCIQIDKVYRAERPQKGRTRELVQCDIDIIGSDSANCEIELINVTAKALLSIGLSNFRVKINDRRILRDTLRSIGFTEEELPSVCITFDKLDKVGVEGIRSELSDKNICAQKIDALISFLDSFPLTLEDLRGRFNQPDAIENLEKIIGTTKALSEGKYDIYFDLSLVRGQGYYTGTVFEIESSDFNSSIAGGGRYDNLIGRFTKENIPAVGFSIGFERIYCILAENNFAIPTAKNKIAVIYDGDFIDADNVAEQYRTEYDVTLFEKPKKLGRLIAALSADGYYGLYVCGKSEKLERLVDIDDERRPGSGVGK